MTESLIKLCLPMLAAAAYYFWEYGLAGAQFFKGYGALKLLGILFFLCHLAALLIYGESRFCGACMSKFITDTFLIPSAGYALVTFSGALSGNVFNSSKEKVAEAIVTFIGIILIVYGTLAILGHHQAI